MENRSSATKHLLHQELSEQLPISIATFLIFFVYNLFLGGGVYDDGKKKPSSRGRRCWVAVLRFGWSIRDCWSRIELERQKKRRIDSKPNFLSIGPRKEVSSLTTRSSTHNSQRGYVKTTSDFMSLFAISARKLIQTLRKLSHVICRRRRSHCDLHSNS